MLKAIQAYNVARRAPVVFGLGMWIHQTSYKPTANFDKMKRW